MLLEGHNNSVAILQWSTKSGFYVDAFDGNAFRDRWGFIHARRCTRRFYDPELMKPSRIGVEYLLPIFTNAIGQDDMESVRSSLFDSGNLTQPVPLVQHRHQQADPLPSPAPGPGLAPGQRPARCVGLLVIQGNS